MTRISSVPSTGSFGATRRNLLLRMAYGAVCLGTRGVALAQPAAVSSQSKFLPVWTGFGLHGGAEQSRFNLTRDYVKKTRSVDLIDTKAFVWLVEPLRKLLAAQNPPSVQFKDSIESGEALLVGFAHDYEIAVGARLDAKGDHNANTILVFMSGVGLILGHHSSTSWRVISSFPFMMRFERLENDLSNIHVKAVARMGDVYKDYGQAFAHFLARFNKWEQGFHSTYFARVTKASIHKDAQDKLNAMKVDKHLNEGFIGFSASASICDNLNIPLLPFQESDALAKRFAVKFNDALRAQEQVDIPDADLRFEVILRDIEKTLIPSKQRGTTTIRRQLVINFRVFDAFNMGKPIFQTFAAAQPDEDKIPHESTEDDTPARDLVFFDRLLTRTLSFLLRGIANNRADLLAQADVKHASVSQAIPILLNLCAKTR